MGARKLFSLLRSGPIRVGRCKAKPTFSKLVDFCGVTVQRTKHQQYQIESSKSSILNPQSSKPKTKTLSPTMAIMLAPRKKLRLMPLAHNSQGRVLKTCSRCRQHKTRCDAVLTHPGPCSHCAKKDAFCTLEVITKKPDRGNEMIENLSEEVDDIKRSLSAMTDRKQKLIQALCRRKMDGPSVATMQQVLVPETSTSPILSAGGLSAESDFILSSDSSREPFSISVSEAQFHFANFENNFLRFLPIFPASFFKKDVMSVYNENDLLFWCILLTSFRHSSRYANFYHLSQHVKARVVEMCWYNTPRHVYTLASLLILTTWPLPSSDSEKIEDDIAVKFIALMKRIALQLGLHKVEFISEFSHKTEVNVSEESHLNNLIRERIYKFVAINSNYWLISLGISNSNYNGTETDYVINKANCLFEGNSPEDKYTNLLLRLSLIQLKLNETMHDSGKGGQVDATKLMNIHMFDVILNRLTQHSDVANDTLTRLSVEYLRLQLFVYAFSTKNVTLRNYKSFIKRALISCKKSLDLYETAFGEVENFAQIPIHYNFCLELASLILMRIYHSPYLDTINEYIIVKENFMRSFNFLSKLNDEEWSTFNSKHLRILKMYDEAAVNTKNIISLGGNSVFIIDKMSNYMVSSLRYEMIRSIYDYKHNNQQQTINWFQYGKDAGDEKDKQVMDYLLTECSIFQTSH